MKKVLSGALALTVMMCAVFALPVTAQAATGTLSTETFLAYEWDSSLGGGVPTMEPWFIMTIDNHLAFGVEPENLVTHSGEYNTTTYDTLDSSQQNAISCAMLYGAQDANDPLLHMATQVIIWQIVTSQISLDTFELKYNEIYNATIVQNPGAAVYYDEIVAAMQKHYKIPSFSSESVDSAPVHTVSGSPGEYKVDLVNTNPSVFLADFDFVSTGTATFEIEQQTLHITTTDLNKDILYFASRGPESAAKSLIYWGSGSDQVRVTAGEALDPITAYFRLELGAPTNNEPTPTPTPGPTPTRTPTPGDTNTPILWAVIALAGLVACVVLVRKRVKA